MVGTMKGFKEEYERCVVDEADIDRLCLRWLQLSCMDHGKTGEQADALLKVVGEMLEI